MKRTVADYHYRDVASVDEATGRLGAREEGVGDAIVAGGVSGNAGGDGTEGPTSVQHRASPAIIGDLRHRVDGGGLVVKGALKAVQYKSGQRPKEATEIRRDLRGSFDARVRVIEAMADGECVEKRQIHLKEVIPYVACPNCGEVGLTAKEEGSGMREVEVLSSVRPKERLVAMEILAKYGLGQLKETSVENVRERVSKTVQLARQMLSPDLADQFILGMKPIWRD